MCTMKFKADTVAQFKCYEWIKKNFLLSELVIKKVDACCLSINDGTNEMHVKYEDSSIYYASIKGG